MLPKVSALLVLVCAVVSAVATDTLSDSEMEELVGAHNYYRRNVEPAASNMGKMVWDSELALLARFWSARCEMMSNEDRHSQSSEFDYVGENMAATSNYSYNLNLTTLVKQWYLKGENYDYCSLTCYEDDDDDDEKREAEEEDACQPYTQLVWAETNKMGCAQYRCEELRGWDDENEDNENALLLVCFYGPGYQAVHGTFFHYRGSFQGVRPYVAGDPCTGCPSNQPLCEDGLCTGGQLGSPAHVSIATLLLLIGMVCTLV